MVFEYTWVQVNQYPDIKWQTNNDNLFNFNILTSLDFSTTNLSWCSKMNFNQLSLHQLRITYKPNCKNNRFRNLTQQEEKELVTTYKSTRVVIPGCFCIPKCFKYTIGLKDFILHTIIATTKSCQVLHSILCCLSFPSSTFTTVG
jgi:hypothetical protein